MFDGTRMHCANLGDSRALSVQIYSEKNKKINIVGQPLSVDHKPEIKEEAERIILEGGIIDTFYDSEDSNKPMGPKRVWVKD